MIKFNKPDNYKSSIQMMLDTSGTIFGLYWGADKLALYAGLYAARIMSVFADY